APMPSTICAALAMVCGSPPKIWIETGRSSSVYSAYFSVRSLPRTSPSALTIRVTTRPQPPWRLTSRRNAVSVMPAIGATAKGECRSREPIFMTVSVRFHISCIGLDRHALADQIDGEHQAGPLAVLAEQPSNHAAQRPVHNLDHRPFPNHRTGVVLQVAAHEQ